MPYEVPGVHDTPLLGQPHALRSTSAPTKDDLMIDDVPTWRTIPAVVSLASSDRATARRLGQGRLSGVLASGAVRVSGRHHIIRDKTVSRKIIEGRRFVAKNGGFRDRDAGGIFVPRGCLRTSRHVRR